TSTRAAGGRRGPGSVRGRARRSCPTRVAAPRARQSSPGSPSRARGAAESSVRFCSRLAQHARLEGGERPHPLPCHGEQALELCWGEWLPFRRTLDLDQPALARHDEIQIHLGAAVLLVVEIEEYAAVNDPRADGGDAARDR